MKKIRELVSKYIQKTERVLAEIEGTQGLMRVDDEKVKSVVEQAKSYLEDAKYYMEKKELETSLASVAYCEGLLDALRLLGGVNFSW
jgi:FAD synthetase